jgi:hypothetical protein
VFVGCGFLVWLLGFWVCLVVIFLEFVIKAYF